jgi:hypothetical protein
MAPGDNTCHGRSVNDTSVPASGVGIYSWSPWRYVLTAAATSFVAAVSGWFLGSLALIELTGRPVSSSVGGGIIFVVTYTVLFPLFSWLLAQARPGVLVFGVDAIEFAAPGHDAVLVPYEIVSTARVRRPWPVTVLEVLVDATDSPCVTRRDRDGRRPLRKHRGDQVRFTMPLAGLQASAPGIRGQLHHRGLSA